MCGRMICPDCKKRGVTIRLANEDYYGCRYCEFYAFIGGSDNPDVRNRRRLLDVNPDHPLRPGK